jgi:LmbE family N-acetylglucosaminyl deacetylase
MKFLIKKFTLPAALFTAALAVPALSQPRLDDPANLAGERVSAPDLADTLPINHGALALEQLLRKLRTRASFMLIVAHPDDEDGGMLTYLSRGQGARVAMLTLTRGEGGQNLMSGDFEDALGLIRTQELLAADRYMGVDQFFGTEVDFGFSKTKEESFAKWTHDRVLYDAVRAVRLYRPLVIGSVFIGAATDGHGQHQVSGEIAQEVFKAAGDPKVFPDQGLPPWQPLKVYARIPFARIDAQGMFDYATNQYAMPRFENYVTGKVTETVPAANVMVPEGATDALLGGLSYVQFARQGLALQKTQIGPGVRTAPAGRADVRYHRYGSRVVIDGKAQPDDGDDTMETGFFDGIDTSLPGIATLAPSAPPALKAVLQLIDGKIEEAQKQFDPANLSAIAEPLRVALQTLDTVISGTEGSTLPLEQKASLLHELRIKRVQLNNALVLALGLSLKASSSAPLLATANTVDVVATLHNGGPVSVMKVEARVAAPTGKITAQDAGPFKPGESKAYSVQVPLRTSLSPTMPYFSRPNIEQPYYDVADPALRNAPGTPAPLEASVALDDDGVPLTIAATVSLANDPNTPAVAVPRLSVAISPSVRMVSTHAPARNSLDFNVLVTTNVADESPRLELDMPHNWTVRTPEEDFSLPKPGDSHLLHVSVTPDGLSKSGMDSIQAFGLEPKLGDTVGTNLGYRAVGYGNLPKTNYYTPATLRVVPVDVTTAPHLNVAYLAGTGDDVASALSDLGVATHTITVADLTPEKLKQYDAVVLGVRPYEAHGDLAAAGAALNAYAANGGVVITQYVARQMPDGAAPYPLSLGSNEKVVDEAAPVAILDAADPLLTWPNKITAADFSGWVEERGHGFMSSWDPHFKPLIETHDPGQQPQQGGLLVARTGKGAWIYLGLALYRQLPEGVPGSYRILANLISAGKH